MLQVGHWGGERGGAALRGASEPLEPPHRQPHRGELQACDQEQSEGFEEHGLVRFAQLASNSRKLEAVAKSGGFIYGRRAGMLLALFSRPTDAKRRATI